MEDFEHIFKRERLEVQPIAGVIVRRHCFRVAVDHDGFVAGFAQGQGRMNTRVVEFNALANAVGPTTQDQHGRLFTRFNFALLVIRGVVVRSLGFELSRTRVNRLVDRANVEFVPQCTHVGFRHPPQLPDLLIGKTHPLGLTDDIRI